LQVRFLSRLPHENDHRRVSVVIFRQELVSKYRVWLPDRATNEKREYTMTRSSSVPNNENPIVRYVRDTRAELSKVTWPTREEGTRLTIVVLIVTFVASIFLFSFDSLFSYLVTLFLQIF
jgi:preprotein translocase subunit SecE